jgi:20S proteasome subunit alpha 7
MGTALLLAVVDQNNGPQLYMVEPSGTGLVRVCPMPSQADCTATWRLVLSQLTPACVWPQRYYGTAVGKGRQAAKTEIERLKLDDMTCQQGVLEVAKMCDNGLLHASAVSPFSPRSV